MTTKSRNSLLAKSTEDDAQNGGSKKEEDELEKLAMNEILIETKRRAETAKEFGALGWQKCPLQPVNKQFLKNTLVSTLRSVPDIKKERKIKEQKTWRQSGYKQNFPQQRTDSRTDSLQSRDRHFSDTEKNSSQDKNSDQRFRSRNLSNSKDDQSHHTDKHSYEKRASSARSTKNSSSSHVRKKEMISETNLTQTKMKPTNSLDEGSNKDMNETASVTDQKNAKAEGQTSQYQKNHVVNKNSEGNAQSTISESTVSEQCEKSMKRKQSKNHCETDVQAKKRKKHKKDTEKKHRSKRKSKKHKKNTTQL